MFKFIRWFIKLLKWSNQKEDINLEEDIVLPMVLINSKLLKTSKPFEELIIEGKISKIVKLITTTNQMFNNNHDTVMYVLQLYRENSNFKERWDAVIQQYLMVVKHESL